MLRMLNRLCLITLCLTVLCAVASAQTNLTAKAGNAPAACQKFTQPAQEDNHRERSQDGMSAEIGDRRAHGRSRRAADGQRCDDANEE